MLHLSVRRLARSSGVSHSQILRIESGEFECLSSSLVQICGALGLPFGEMLERCTVADLEFYSGAVEAELAGIVKEDTERKRALIDLVFGASVALSYILRASNPVAVAKELIYPSGEIATKFRRFAEHITTQPLDAGQRFIFLNRLRSRPAETLREFFEFPSKKEIAAHVAVSRKKEPMPGFPWRPERLAPSLAVWNASIAEEFYSGKKVLTDTATFGIPVAVKHQMPNLLSRLNKATQEAGKMSALAAFLSKASGKKVPLASVSRWLSGKREPGGEIALQMLYWVEHPELQK